MFKKILPVFLLPISSFLFVPFLATDKRVLVKENEINNTVYSEKSDNPNNYWMVDYEDSNNVMSYGNKIVASIVESSEGQYISVTSASLNFRLIEGYTVEEFIDEDIPVYLTLYDITDGEYNDIDQIELNFHDGYSLGSWSGFDDALLLSFYSTATISFDVKLEEFHKYQVGFNFIPGDDYEAYSEILTLDVPQLSKFIVTPTINSVEIEYELSNLNSNVTFDYSKVYIELDGTYLELNNQSSGIFPIIDNLDQATEYSMTFGYEATKTIAGFDEYQIANEFEIKVSTVMPPNFGEGLAIASLIMLILLIIIILILIVIILYWNHQRRKISGMALVVGEDTQAYDPVYQHNYYQQDDKSHVPNATSNEGNEVYGYFDEVQDNQEEPYGYFDEVQEDLNEDDVYDIDNPDEGELL